MDGLPGLDELIAAAKAAAGGSAPNAADVAALLAAVRADGRDAALAEFPQLAGFYASLDAYAPAIDELRNRDQSAAFLGILPATLSQDRRRPRKDGVPGIPAPDGQFGRSSAWTARHLALHKAAAPGPGGSGRFQPGISGNPAYRKGKTTKAKASAGQTMGRCRKCGYKIGSPGHRRVCG